MRPHALELERLERRALFSAGTAAPSISAPGRVSVVEDTATPLQVKVFDRDSPTLSVRLQASSGYLTARAAPGVTVTSPDNRILVIEGLRSGMNTTLQSVRFRPYEDITQPATVSVSVSDGIHRVARSIAISVVPVNDAPRISTPERIFASRGTIDLGPYPVYDPDSPVLTVTFTSDNGTVRIVDPAARNLGSTARLRGSWQTIDALLGAPGSLVLAPAADRNTRLTITVGDGLRRTTRVVTVSHAENLPQVATDAVNGRIAGRDPAVAKPVFAVMDHDAATYVRNPDAWTRDLDLTCVSPWNSAGINWLAGTLVSPRHVVFSTHFPIPVGATVRFVTRDNVVVDRTLVGAISPPYVGQSAFPDISVGVLDSDVPPSIGFARILPDDWAAYLPDRRLEIPLLAINQREAALVTSLWWLDDQVLCSEPADATQRAFFDTIVTGDSGHPGFMIVDDQLVLLTVWTMGSGGMGTFTTGQRAAIDGMMAQLGGGYRLTTIDIRRLGRF